MLRRTIPLALAFQGQPGNLLVKQNFLKRSQVAAFPLFGILDEMGGLQVQLELLLGGLVETVGHLVEGFELKGAAPASRVQTTAGALTRFLGREDELRRLERLLEKAAAGEGQVVGVAGEAGVGKSRLVWEFTRSTRAQAWLLMEAPAVAYAKATPYAPITAMRLELGRIVQCQRGFEIGLDHIFRRRQDIGNEVIAELDLRVEWAADLQLSQRVGAGRDHGDESDHKQQTEANDRGGN